MFACLFFVYNIIEPIISRSFTHICPDLIAKFERAHCKHAILKSLRQIGPQIWERKNRLNIGPRPNGCRSQFTETYCATWLTACSVQCIRDGSDGISLDLSV